MWELFNSEWCPTICPPSFFGINHVTEPEALAVNQVAWYDGRHLRTSLGASCASCSPCGQCKPPHHFHRQGPPSSSPDDTKSRLLMSRRFLPMQKTVEWGDNDILEHMVWQLPVEMKANDKIIPQGLINLVWGGKSGLKYTTNQFWIHVGFSG